jgi:hypothetical protein
MQDEPDAFEGWTSERIFFSPEKEDTVPKHQSNAVRTNAGLVIESIGISHRRSNR